MSLIRNLTVLAALMLSCQLTVAQIAPTAARGAGFSSIQAVLNQSTILMGGQDAGGGNVFEVEFKTIGQALYNKMQEVQLRSDQVGFEVVNFGVAVREVQVLGTNQTIQLNDAQRSAINSQNQRLIVFNNQVWALLDGEQKEMLVLHEYLRFVGVDDSDYGYTMRVRELLELNPDRKPGPGHSKYARTIKVVGVEEVCIGSFGGTCKSGKVKFKIEGFREADFVEMYCWNNALIYANFKISNGKVEFYRKVSSENECKGIIAYMTLATPQQPVHLIIDPQGESYSGMLTIQ